MPFKTILTVTAPELGEDDVALATALCETAGAHLSALVVQVIAPMPVGDYAGMVPEAWLLARQQDEARLAARRDALTARLATTAISADVATEFTEHASLDEVIGRRARYADLTLVGPEVLAADPLGGKVIEGALFGSGKPLLLVPGGARADLAPRRVLVAWDARIEAVRAVREALDLLVGADDVRLVLVDPVAGGNGHGAEPGADAAAHLARHGVRVSVERVPSEGHSVAEILRRRCIDFGADLLVMGAWGHSRLRERIFGGVTRSMLESPPVPIFMAR